MAASWHQLKVKNVHRWTTKLFSLILENDGRTFIPGQFTRLALEQEGKKVARSFSYVSPPGQDLEFYLVAVEGGELSSVYAELQAGDTALVSDLSAGFLTLEEVPPAKELWMLSTGTGIGPFLSILQEGKKVFANYQKIVLVHGVQYVQELAYRDLLLRLVEEHKDKFVYLPFTSQEQHEETECGRFTTSLQSKKILDSAGVDLHAASSHVMLCGNPEMIKQSSQLLTEVYGMKRHRRADPGQFSLEAYW